MSSIPTVTARCPHCGTPQLASAACCSTCGRPLAADWRLRVLQGPGQGRTTPLTTAPLVIGRQPGSTLLLNDPRVSRTHARIAWDGTGFVITDLGSSGGTTVNQVRLAAPAYLRPGDRIGLGGAVELRLEYVVPQPASAAASAPLPGGVGVQPAGAGDMHAPGVPASTPPAGRALPVAQRRAGRGRGCAVALLLLAVVATVSGLALNRTGWPPPIVALLGGLLPAPQAGAALPDLPSLPGPEVEQPAITATLSSLSAALRAGDVDAAVILFAPEVQADYRALFEAHPDHLADLGTPLTHAELTFLSPYASTDGNWRSAEVAVEVDGITFYIAMVKVDGRWLVKTM